MKFVIELDSCDEEELKTVPFLIENVVSITEINWNNIVFNIINLEQLITVIEQLNDWGYAVRIVKYEKFTLLELY